MLRILRKWLGIDGEEELVEEEEHIVPLTAAEHEKENEKKNSKTPIIELSINYAERYYGEGGIHASTVATGGVFGDGDSGGGGSNASVAEDNSSSGNLNPAVKGSALKWATHESDKKTKTVEEMKTRRRSARRFMGRSSAKQRGA